MEHFSWPNQSRERWQQWSSVQDEMLSAPRRLRLFPPFGLYIDTLSVLSHVGKIHQTWEANMLIMLKRNTYVVKALSLSSLAALPIKGYSVKCSTRSAINRYLWEIQKDPPSAQRRSKGIEGWSECVKSEKRVKRGGWLKHPQVNNKSFTSKNRDSCASGYQLMSRECLSFQESKSAWYESEAAGAYGWWSVANYPSLSENEKNQHKGNSNNSINEGFQAKSLECILGIFCFLKFINHHLKEHKWFHHQKLMCSTCMPVMVFITADCRWRVVTVSHLVGIQIW